MTDAERWARVEALFNAALETPPETRSAWLRRECAEDGALQAEVEALLAAEQAEAASGFLAGAVGRAAEAFAGGRNWIGREVGPYRILGEIGRGGMGSVFLAERADQSYAARVAIKLVRGGLASAELQRRFLTERQILADLVHPNIARLLDGGATADGTPYLVMEYIEGQRIDAWCDSHKLGVTARVALLREVCRGVQHAHQALVVHRDLKPSNVLVTAAGTPKLLDFGIAKLLEPGLTPTDDTGSDLRLMTPAYASPEQIRGQRVTVATDIHALGAILYTLLTGEPPFGTEGGLVALARRVTEDEPRAPSAVVRRAGRVPPGLSRDLDAIVLKALAKEPAQRYASVERFAEDLDRALQQLPVTARTATPSERMMKFVARHRGAVVAGSLLLVAVLGGSAATLWQARQAERARTAAERALAQSEEVRNFLLGLFRANDPRQAQGEEITARELLERGVQRADSLDGQPALQAELLYVLGTIQRTLGQYQQGDDLIARSAASWRAQPDADPRHLVMALNARGNTLNDLGLPDSAAAAWEEAIALGSRTLGPDDDEVLSAENNLGIAYGRLGRDPEAEALYRRRVVADEKRLGRDGIDRASPLNNLGVLLASQGRYAEAEPPLREALRVVTANVEPNDPWRSYGLDNLGMTLREAGRFDEAEPLVREGLDLRSRTMGPEHRITGESYFSLGTLLAMRGRPADLVQADSMLATGARIYRQALGEAHPALAYIRHSQGILARQSGDLEGAIRWFEAALTIRASASRDNPRVTTETLLALGYVRRDAGRPQADSALRAAYELATAKLAADDAVRQEAIVARATVKGEGVLHDPDADVQQAIAQLAHHVGPTHARVRAACQRAEAAGLNIAAPC